MNGAVTIIQTGDVALAIGLDDDGNYFALTVERPFKSLNVSADLGW